MAYQTVIKSFLGVSRLVKWYVYFQPYHSEQQDLESHFDLLLDISDFFCIVPSRASDTARIA